MKHPPIRIFSVNVGLPRTIQWRDREVTTGIFKEPVEGPLVLRRFNLDGDGQADLENHGGRVKAIYAYPSEHYELWRKELPGVELSWGAFGENLTTEGLQEETTYIGDHFRAGQALLMVTQPRIPCYKLGIRLGSDEIVKRFLESNRSGVYFSVLEEGIVKAGDTMERVQEDPERISVTEINRAIADSTHHVPVLRRAVRHNVLPPGLRDHFLERLAAIESR